MAQGMGGSLCAITPPQPWPHECTPFQHAQHVHGSMCITQCSTQATNAGVQAHAVSIAVTSDGT
eukprot:4892420-Alexandrium_andersonii.AAC.1